jgi:tripartite-type tricarboxylate transporter receptor subunit TctC
MSKVLKQVVTLVLSLSSAAVAAQDRYPAKPVRIIAAIAAGSLTDVVLRRAAVDLTASLGQSLVIDNRPGANTVVGADACAKAAPDGHTFCVLNRDTVSVIPHISLKLPYDAEKDLKGVTALYQIVQGYVATGSLPASSMKELEALAKAKPDGLNFATFGENSNPDVARKWLNEQWRVNIVGVPYKGANLILNALLAGEVHMTRISLGSMAAQAATGRVKVLAVGSEKRSRLFPDVPTYAEAGVGGSPEGLWWGLFAPAGTPDPMVKAFHAHVAKVFQDSKFRDYLERESLEPAVTSPEEFQSFLKQDRESGARIVKKYNIPRK